MLKINSNINRRKIVFKSGFLLVLGCALLSPLAASFAKVSKEVSATEEHGTEQKASSYWVSELPNFKANGTSLNNDGVLSNTGIGRYVFDYSFTNVEVKGEYHFSNVPEEGGYFSINARSTVTDATLMSWENRGYEVFFYQNGTYSLNKNTTTVIETTSGAKSLSADKVISYSFKVVNCEDGSVHVSCDVDGATLFDYYDTENVIVSGGVGGFTNNISYTVESDASMPVLNMSDKDIFLSGTTVMYKSIEEDGSIITNAESSHGYSGVAYKHQISHNKYAIRAQVTPATSSSTIVLQLLGENGDINQLNGVIAYPTLVDQNWGWKNSGYLFYLFSNGSNGHAFLSRSGYESAMVDTWGLNLNAETTYDVEYGVSEFDYGDLIYFKLNGQTYLRYFDLKRDSYPEGTFAPVHIPAFDGNAITSKSAVTRFGGFYSMLSSVKYSFDHDPVEKKTLISKDLGEPTALSNASMLSDGEIGALFPGGVVGYNVESNRLDITFKMTISSFEGTLPSTNFLLNYVGSNIGGQKSASWTKKGYTLTWLYNGDSTNCMFGLNKYGEYFAIGWDFNAPAPHLDTEYLIRIGEEELADGSMLIFMYIDGTNVLSFVDGVDPLNSPGWFVCESGGDTCSMSQVGYDQPVLDVETTTINEDETLELNYVNPQPGDVVEYAIDESLSSGEAFIRDGVLTPYKGGTIAVYAVVNGVASDRVSITVQEFTKALISISNDKLVVGSTTATLTASISDETPITESHFVVEPITGDAEVNQETGVLTGTKAGTIKVYSVVNGLTSTPIIVYVNPIVYITDAYAIALGGSRVLHYAANCELPNEEIKETYEIMSGSENCTYDSETHVLTGTQLGVIKMRVKVVGETFAATSGIIEISVEKPLVIIAPDVKDMVVGATQTINATINNGEIAITSKQIVIDEGASLVEVSGLKIKALKPGQVKMHVVLNGISSMYKKFAITPLIGVIQASDMRIGTEQKLSVKFNDFSMQIKSVKYSITSGSEYATIKGSTLKALDKIGSVVVEALVNNSIKVSKTIEIFADVELVLNFDRTKTINIGEEYLIFFNYYGKDKPKDISLNISRPDAVKTKRIVVNNNGEKRIGFSFTPTKAGKNRISIIVNGKESNVLEINIASKKLSLGAILGLSIGIPVGAAAIFCGTFFPIRAIKRKKGATK